MAKTKKTIQTNDNQAVVTAASPAKAADPQATSPTEPTRGQKIVWKSGWAAGASIPE